MNEGLTGLERHEGNYDSVINDRIFIFGWTIPLKTLINRLINNCPAGPQQIKVALIRNYDLGDTFLL